VTTSYGERSGTENYAQTKKAGAQSQTNSQRPSKSYYKRFDFVPGHSQMTRRYERSKYVSEQIEKKVFRTFIPNISHFNGFHYV